MSQVLHKYSLTECSHYCFSKTEFSLFKENIVLIRQKNRIKMILLPESVANRQYPLYKLCYDQTGQHTPVHCIVSGVDSLGVLSTFFTFPQITKVYCRGSDSHHHCTAYMIRFHIKSDFDHLEITNNFQF